MLKLASQKRTDSKNFVSRAKNKIKTNDTKKVSKQVSSFPAIVLWGLPGAPLMPQHVREHEKQMQSGLKMPPIPDNDYKK